MLNGIDFNVKDIVIEKKESKWEKELERYQAVKRLLDEKNAELEATRLWKKVENLAKKLARGEYLTESERALLAKHDPEKMRKAQLANLRKQNIERQLKNAKTKEEANLILAGASSEVATAYDKDEEYGELLSEAVNQVVTDYARGKEGKVTYLKYKSYDLKV